MLDVGLLGSLSGLNLRLTTLGHASTTNDQVDKQGNRSSNENRDDPQCLCPALQRVIRENVEHDHEEEHEVHDHEEQDEQGPQNVCEMHVGTFW